MKELLKHPRAVVKIFITYLWDKIVLKKSASILMYHSVANNREFFTVKPEEFLWQMKYLYENKYNVISLDRLVEYLSKNESLPEKTVVLTFDDGYEDNFANVFPVLTKYNFPATIFLVTDRVGNKEYKNKRGVSMPILDWDEITRMHNSKLIDFQPHSVSHPKLAEIRESQVRVEMENSKLEIERKLDKDCKFFCFPYGSYDARVIEIGKKMFISLCSVESGFIGRGHNRVLLNRNSVDSMTNKTLFKLKI